MLCGTPVLTTEVGFGHELVGLEGERGWIVPSGDSAAIAQTIRRLIEEPRDWVSLRRRCRSFAERFTLEGWAREIARISTAQWKAELRDGRFVS